MYHLTILWLAITAVAYVAGVRRGKRAQRQIGSGS